MDLHICIGTENRTELARKVLEFSIHQHLESGFNLYCHAMSSASMQPSLKGLTGFSLQRWMIPFTFPNLKRAIYLDADQLLFQSIHKLWQQPEFTPDPSASIWCCYKRGRPQTSVMVIDCDRARDQWLTPDQIATWLKPGKDRMKAYRKLMRAKCLAQAPVSIDSSWNHFDHYLPGETQLLHFTQLRTQPWRDPKHPHASVWGNALGEALQAGAIPWLEVDKELRAYQARVPGKGWGCGLHPYWKSWLAEHFPRNAGAWLKEAVC